MSSTMDPLHLVAHPHALWTRLGADGAASFDAAGRLMTWREGALYFRRGLDNTILEMRRDARGPWPWATRRIAGDSKLYHGLLARISRLQPDSARAEVYLDRARRGLEDAYRADARAFAAAIGPVPIVPPNHARSVVVRLTEGCAWNRCTFCSLYTRLPFRVRSTGEFRDHVRGALAYFGEGLGVRPEVWVGDASLLEAGADAAVAALAALKDELRPAERPAVVAFSDVPNAARLASDAARELARLGVRRLYLGVETGHGPLARDLAKAHRPDQVVEAVHRLHAAGIGAGIILMVGIGGKTLAAAHRRDSALLLTQLDLGGEDFVFLSPLDTQSRQGPLAGAEPFSEAELAHEVRAVRQDIRAAVARPSLRIADYGLDNFVY